MKAFLFRSLCLFGVAVALTLLVAALLFIYLPPATLDTSEEQDAYQ